MSMFFKFVFIFLVRLAFMLAKQIDGLLLEPYLQTIFAPVILEMAVS
jgi:hypothetical protein